MPVWLDDLGRFIGHLLTDPDTYASFAIVAGLIYHVGKKVRQFAAKSHNNIIDVMQENYEATNKRIDMIEVNQLRIQLTVGMNQKTLSLSEASYFFDRYKELGGNSFVEHKYHQYIRDLEGGELDDRI